MYVLLCLFYTCRVPLTAEDLFINSITLHTITTLYYLLPVPSSSRMCLLKYVFDLSGPYVAYSPEIFVE